MGSHTANNKSSVHVCMCECVWLLIIKCLIKHSCRTAPCPSLCHSLPPQSCYIWATAGFAQANIEMGQKRCENDLKYFFWQRRKMFSCSSTLILPFSHSHTHTLHKKKKKCEAINNKAKSKTKFNKRDSKRNVANPTLNWSANKPNTPL